jgi:hypothetical protein
MENEGLEKPRSLLAIIKTQVSFSCTEHKKYEITRLKITYDSHKIR